MLILLDTTAIMSDPMCGGIAWRVLANAPSAWDVQIFVPEVVVVEAVAGYQRRLNDAVIGISSWEKKYATLLGLTNVTEAIDTALKESAEAYPVRLRDSLNELHVKILAPPNIDHMELVQRAATRRRPCDDKGDGYRDTLNWLTVLALASQYPEAQIVWVSDNSRDFGSRDGTELHEDLMSDLVALGAEKRVRWIRTLADLVLALTAEHTSEAPGTLKEIQARLHAEALRTFISSQVLAVAAGTTLDPRRCGLPIITTSAKVLTIGNPSDLRFTVRGTTADNETALEFDLEASTSIEIEVPPGATPDIGGLATAASVDPAGSTIQLTKLLRFRGLVTLDGFDRPLGGELTDISAKEDDPGLAQWSIRDVSSSLRALGISALPPELFQTIRLSALPPELLRSMRVPALPPELFQGMMVSALPPELLKNIKIPVIPPELLKNIKIPVIPPELLKNILPNLTSPKPMPPEPTDAQASESSAEEPKSLDGDQPDDEDGRREDPDEENGSA